MGKEPDLREMLRRAICDFIEPMVISHLTKDTEWREEANKFIQEVVPHVFGANESVFGQPAAGEPDRFLSKSGYPASVELRGFSRKELVSRVLDLSSKVSETDPYPVRKGAEMSQKADVTALWADKEKPSEVRAVIRKQLKKLGAKSSFKKSDLNAVRALCEGARPKPKKERRASKANGAPATS